MQPCSDPCEQKTPLQGDSTEREHDFRAMAATIADSHGEARSVILSPIPVSASQSNDNDDHDQQRQPE